MKRRLRRLYANMVQLFRSGRCSCISSRTMDCDERTVCTLTESPLEGVLEKLSLNQPAGRRVSPHCLLMLPMEVLDGIFRHTDSRDALALSGTCTRLRPLTTWAYRDVRFVLGRPERPKTLSATVEALQLLLGALRSRPDHAMAVRSIVLCDPIPANLGAVNSANVPWQTWNLLAEQLDFNVAELLSLTPMLRRFIWSNYAVGHYTDVQQTMTRLKRLQYLQNMSVYRARADISDAELDSRTHSIRPERLSVDCLKSSPWWCLPFLRNNNRLRSLDLRFAGDPQDTEWTRELYLAAISWRKLETLNVECSEEEARAMLGLITHCAACESWPSLTSISFKPMLSHNRSILPEFLTALRSFPIRRLHLTANEFGVYHSGFSPELVGNIFGYLPNLEELVLDHNCSTEFTPMPGTLEEWGRALRMAPNLRVLTLPTLWVTDGLPAPPPSHCASSSYEDTLYEASTIAAPSALDRLPRWLQPVYLPLSIFAEDLADVHLRRPRFRELRFIHDVVTPNPFYRECRMVRFTQETDPDAPGERYMMKYLGVMGEGLEEDEAFFWIPKALRRSL